MWHSLSTPANPQRAEQANLPRPFPTLHIPQCTVSSARGLRSLWPLPAGLFLSPHVYDRLSHALAQKALIRQPSERNNR
jgi:hypothetical protein